MHVLGFGGIRCRTSAHRQSKATIDIAYSALSGGLQGAHKVSGDDENYVMTQMEPIGACNVFPGFDEPDFKHPWKVTLIVPASDTAVANTRLESDDTLDDGWHKLRFSRTENLPSYLIAFAVGPLDILEWQDIPPSEIRAAPLKLRGIALKGRARQMSYALASTASIVAAEERYFGIAYPFDKLDVLATPDFRQRGPHILVRACGVRSNEDRRKPDAGRNRAQGQYCRDEELHGHLADYTDLVKIRQATGVVAS